ncbi:MAG TPA: hypothetical protein VK911_17070, partial [Vicinamibacterales bacterium]|nr:hypothetical protein [Vicinamibacterales bacterium]
MPLRLLAEDVQHARPYPHVPAPVPLPAAIAVVLAVLFAAPATAVPRNAVPDLLQKGANAAYNLDYDQALQFYRQAAALAPDDPGPHRALASLAWLQALFLRGTVTVD